MVLILPALLFTHSVSLAVRMLSASSLFGNGHVIYEAPGLNSVTLAAVAVIQHSLRLLWHDEARRHFYY
jgi:hypothetical protein